MNKKIFTILLVSIVFFILGFVISSIKNKNDNNISFQAGWNAATERLYEIGVLEENKRNYPIKSVAGVVKSIDNEKVYVNIVPVEALASKELDNRIVIINDNTKFFKYIKKDKEKIVQEKEKLLKQGVYEEPELYEKKEVLKTDLQPQKRIVIHALKDIRNDKQFIASEIIIQK